MNIFLISAKSELKYSLHKIFYHRFYLFFNFGFDIADLYIFFLRHLQEKANVPSILIISHASNVLQ